MLRVEPLEDRRLLTVYSSTDVPVGIDTHDTLYTSTINVADSISISDINVTLDITHTYDSDLDVFLQSPTGTVVELFTDVGNDGDDFTNTTLDDEAGTSISSAPVPFTGTYIPEGSLSSFDDESASGDWILQITDDGADDTGTLNSWSIDITPTSGGGSGVDIFVYGTTDVSSGFIVDLENMGHTVTPSSTFPADPSIYDVITVHGYVSNQSDATWDNYVSNGGGLIIFEGAMQHGSVINTSANANPVASYSNWNQRTGTTVIDVASPLSQGLAADSTLSGYAIDPVLKAGANAVIQWEAANPQPGPVMAATYSHGAGDVVFFNDFSAWYDNSNWTGDHDYGYALMSNAVDYVLFSGPDVTPPSVLSTEPADSSTLINANVDIDVTFSEPVSGVDSTDLVLTGTAAASATVSEPTNTSGNTWRFPISGLVDGPLDVSLAPDTDDIEDIAENELANTTWSYTVGILELDFGDAPNSTYPTLLASDGARHIVGGLWMGNFTDWPDIEPDGQPDSSALGDDTLDGNDDEDGVAVTPIKPGHSSSVTIEVSGAPGMLDAWIDFNRNGTWESGEHLFAGVSEPLVTGINVLTFSVPAGAMPGPTFGRFRISSQGGLAPTGLAEDGEVEDHLIQITDPTQDSKWTQWPDLSPYGIDVRATNELDNPMTLADDWLCTEPSLLTDVHLWGSWLQDEVGVIENLHLSAHSDDPIGLGGADPDNQYSKPDELLWEMDFDTSQIAMNPFYTAPDIGEYWWDPVTGQLIPNADKTVWKIDVDIDPGEAFIQEGTPDNPIVYWLDVSVTTSEGTQFGWKTRQHPDHYNDDAVWVDGTMPDWQEMHYPPGHPYLESEQTSIDLAFELTFDPITYDFGDAPDTPYPTLLANNGASHIAVGPTLGTLRDSEPDGQPTPSADGDDLTGLPDEDGVMNFPIIAPGIKQTPIQIQASAPSFLNAWIDYNQNGTWETSEQIAGDVPMVAGANTLLLDVPLTALPGTTYTRLRLTSYNTGGALLPTGVASDGEVEDYMVTVENDVYLEGTTTGDTINVWPGTPGGAQHRVQINGVNSFFDAAVYDAIYLDGLTGIDTLNVYGKSTAENAAFDGTSVHVNETSVYDVYAQDFENAYAFGGGGVDTTQMLGSTGNDNFYANRTYSYLRGNSNAFLNYAKNFATIGVDMTTHTGGTDNAYMYDSSGDDILVAGETQATLDYDSLVTPGVDITAMGFNRVDTYGHNGGSDTATLTGSSGVDTFIGLPAYSYVTGNGGTFVNYVKGFGDVTANVSVGGGADTATLYDSSGNDTLDAGATQNVLDYAATGTPDPNVTAIGFPNVSVYALFGGDDTATLTGSSGNDRFTGRETYGRMKGNSSAFINFAKGFDTLTGDVSGTTGTDIAILYDSTTDDDLVAGETEAYFDYAATGTVDKDVTAIGFDQTYSYATGGGDDESLMNGSSGVDRFTAKSTYSNLNGNGGAYFHYATGFDESFANATLGGGGGTDLAFLYDDSTDDLFTGGPTQATLDYDSTVSPGTDVTADGFDEVYAYADNGGTDAAVLNGASSSTGKFYGLSTYGYYKANDSSFYNYARGFDTLLANAGSSTDYAYLYGSDGNDTLNADSNSTAFSLVPTSTPAVVNTAAAFDHVYTYASGGGTDKAYLDGTTGADTFTGDTDWGYLRSTGTSDYFNYVRYFDEVYADPGDTTVGNDDLNDLGVTYTLDSTPGNGNVW
jgi:subtilisin-like proprotein convertase family protein